MSSIGTLINELHTWDWLAILLARLAVGLPFFLSGRGKLFVPERREQMRETLVVAHVPFPEFNTVFVAMWSWSSVRFSYSASQHLSPP
jgi:putative oxidoreductase